MKYLLFLLILSSILFADEPYIKSLRAFKAGNELSAPIIRKGEKLQIEFDVEADRTPDFIILFRFCDQNWKPYEIFSSITMVTIQSIIFGMTDFLLQLQALIIDMRAHSQIMM
jgi:hypothetical protein